jgi:hypothetical protein
VCPRPQVASRLLDNGTVGLMVSALEGFDDHKYHLQVQHACLWGIESLILPVDHRPVDDPLVPVASLVTVTAKAMRRYPNFPSMQAGGCSVIWRLADYLGRVPHQLREAEILSLALAAMERLPASPEVQSSCAGAVGSSVVALAGGGEDQGGEVARAPELVLSAMRAFPRNTEVQQMGCFALTELEGSGLVARGALGRAGAWGVVASALSRHQRGVFVLASCCMAVTVMSKREPRGLPAAVGAAVDAVLAAFPGEDDMMSPCLGAQEALWLGTLSPLDDLLSAVAEG